MTKPENRQALVTAAEASPLGVLTGTSRRFETYSLQLWETLSDLEIAANQDATILLIGETGAGKSYLARLIHEISSRRYEPFLPVSCGAMPNELIENELFGHARGSTAKAHRENAGKFNAARQGSIVLDEIDTLGLGQQVKLLRVMETGKFEPVGSNHTRICQARLIVASHFALHPLVEQGVFRPDLYNRLNALKFVIPPLRHRNVDIVPLARKFIRQSMIKHSIRLYEIDPNFFAALLDYPWPGNVRELEHVVEGAMLSCRSGRLMTSHLPEHILSCNVGLTNSPSVVFSKSPAVLDGSGDKVEFKQVNQIASNEKEIIEQTLFKNGFSRTTTAKHLGISRILLYNKLKKYGLQN